MKRKKFEQSVIVVGAGAAGITAAALLKSDGFDVTVLEASDRILGRIFPDNNFAPFPIDLGAEFIHGHRTEFYRGIKKMQLPLAEEEGVNYFWYKNRLYFEEELPENEDFEAFFEFVDGKHQYRGKDNSVANFLKKFNIPTEMMPFYIAHCAAYGSSPEKIGLAALAREERMWDAGGENYRLKVSLADYFLPDIAAIKEQIVLNEEVKHIRSEEYSCEVITRSGKSFRADFVLVCVPLTVLQRNLINFEPPFSEEKNLAMYTFGMGAGFKLVLKFKKRFFPEDFKFLTGTSKNTHYYSAALGRHEDNTYISCFSTGKAAERFTGMTADKSLNILDEILDELEDVFSVRGLHKEYENHLFKDWTNTPFIMGAYSFPRPGAHGKRKFLAETHAERVFFAGEACSVNGHAATVHGAIETAINAAADIKNKVLMK